MVCPFCHTYNNCSASAGVTLTCWCFDVQVPAELVKLVPHKTVDKSCICLSCIQLFKQNPEKFMLNLTIQN
ncbi:cysteine-rich CWC family protein [Paraglaciecola sp. L3A3]|uniref:cysteine-rich CWC family protein n=1 Tax=Paraglaciecola sp. L3A3 TaxID=2686358 RepID=UPI00351A45A4